MPWSEICRIADQQGFYLVDKRVMNSHLAERDKYADAQQKLVDIEELCGKFADRLNAIITERGEVVADDSGYEHVEADNGEQVIAG